MPQQSRIDARQPRLSSRWRAGAGCASSYYWVPKAPQAEKPDVLVSTGDLVDGQMNKLSGLAGMIRETPTKYGKYAVMGNHEFYAGL
jgi:predicted MPP superfamily phosphohydrolase